MAWEGGQWISFAMDEDGEIVDRINCGADEDRARGLANLTANMRAGSGGLVELNGEDG